MSEEATAPKQGDPNAEASKYRKMAKTLKGRVAELESLLSDVPSPDESAARVAELEGKLRQRDHMDAFRRLAAEKIRPEALEDAYTLSGWTADADEVDEQAMTSTIDNLVLARAYLAVPAAEVPATEGETVSPPVERSFSLTRPVPAKGSGRGHSPNQQTNQNTRANYRL
jgi:hypothetical protein